MKFISLFAGVGGFEIGLERAGMTCVAQVEISPYCRKVLTKHWPDVPKFEDVRKFSRSSFDGEVDLICGGFPCQDISIAGKRAGMDGERSGLWSEFYRIICEFRPTYVLVENVSALLVPENGKYAAPIGRVLGDLASSGFDAEWDCLPAGHFGAPHRRDRIYLLAYPHKEHGRQRLGVKSFGSQTVFSGHDIQSFPIWLQTANRFIGMDDGISSQSYRSRGEALGNAIVPQVTEWIGRKIMEVSPA